MLKTLSNLGFKEHDAQVYIFLGLNGPKKAKDIAVALETYKRKVYRSLRQLQNRGLIKVSSRLPGEFSATSFDQVLELLRLETIKETDQIEQKKDYFVALWKTNVTGEPQS
jgi:sugar-specific transcriptional regulator TrmB